MNTLSDVEFKRFSRSPVKCRKLRVSIESLADYFSVIGSTTKGSGTFWFRGHAKVDWRLTPSALRFAKERDRDCALRLLADFKRVAEMKLSRPPRGEEELMWVQIARHYGLPTRLLDWTESPTVALYFCCCESNLDDGMVFILNPIDLNRVTFPKKPRILEAHSDGSAILKYLRLGGKHRAAGKSPIAMNPIWNSERLMLQRGTFTLHGARFDLDAEEVASLVAIPILSEFKGRLLGELQRIGVDEMTIFAELEHACNHLKRKSGLS